MKSVVTIGLGYIGLPTSALIASQGTPVFGVDIYQNVVDTINKGEIHIVEPELDGIVKKAVEKGLLKAGTKARPSDVYLIVVPTPFKGDHEPDISYVESATKGILPLLKEDDLYIIESTSPIGTTEKMKDLIYTKRPELKDKINIAYCPERVLPGNVMYELVHNDRVIGGVDEKSTEKAVNFYSQYVKGELHKTNAKDLSTVFKKYSIDKVCHLAAQAGVRYSIENPSAYTQSNLVGFGNILEEVRHAEIDHLIYASSSSVYGEAKKVPFSTDQRVDHPVSLYAATKKQMN